LVAGIVARPAWHIGDAGMNKIRVVLADDCQVVRSGLGLLLGREPDIEVVGEATDSVGAVETAGRLNPDVLVLDGGMLGCDGRQPAGRLRDSHPTVQLVVLTTESDAPRIQEWLATCTCGYVGKAATSEELLNAIRAASRSRNYISSDLRAALGGQDGSAIATDATALAAITKLGTREREVLRLLAMGLSSRQIAAKMYLSTKTVNTHRRNVKQKLKIHSLADLVKFAIRAGLVSLGGPPRDQTPSA
jgi:DNA-binding NarL/FixJ family response regulator